MSMWIAGAMVVSTGVAAVSSKNAAKENSRGVQKGLDQSLDITNQARNDVMSLFDGASRKAMTGTQEALNFYKQNAQKRIEPYVKANMGAQSVIGQGAQQANNAILGLPVDMSFATQQPKVQADYSGINSAVIPQSIATPNSVYTPSSGAAIVTDEAQGRLAGIERLRG